MSAAAIRVGPAGWSYADWAGKVYPRRKPRGFHPLAYLARFVQCLEINSTFYAPPRADHAQRWAQLVKGVDGFLLTAKLHRDFTHAELAGSSAQLEAQAEVFMRGLAPLVRNRLLAALLVQFPLSFHHGNAQVRHLGTLRSLFAEVPLVLEVRHASWFTERALHQISGLGYSLAYIDLPEARDHPPAWHGPTGPLGYLRLHGRNRDTWFARGAGRDARYDYLYSERELEGVVDRALRIAGGHDQTFVITNNHFEGKAVVNALEVLAGLRGGLVDAPAPLVQAYPRLESKVRVVDDLPPSGQQELF